MDAKVQELKRILGERVKENEPLAPHTTLKIGGPADLFYEARTQAELTHAVTSTRRMGIPVFVLGGGSNILVGDRGIRGVVVKNSTGTISIKGIKGTVKAGRSSGLVYVEADSGVVMNKLVRFTIEEGLGGLEMHLGLPGSVGGAVYMNSKWTHPEGYTGDVVYQAKIFTAKGEEVSVPKSYFRFGYDSSILQTSGDILLSVVFALRNAERKELWRVANESIAYRRSSQPQGVCSAGCTFRNITQSEALALSTPNHTTSSGFLLDHAGVKSLAVGDAQVSPVHANFIINKGHAKASDVVQLVEMARECVRRKFGVDLVEEIIRVGEF